MKNNLFLILGDDKKIIDFNLFNILNNIDYDNNNKIVYDMNINSFMDVIEEASMVSLFSSIKVIIVNNFLLDNLNDSEFEYLDRFVNNKVLDVYMIFISNKVDARKKNYKLFKDNFNIIEVDKFDDGNIYDYVMDKINDKGYKIDNIDVTYFLSKVGNDINNINSELDKLFIYKYDDKKILKEDIDLLILDNIDNVIYEFTNAILDCDYDKVKIMYDKFMIDNISIDYLIATVAGSIRNSLVIKILNRKNMSNFEIGKIIGKKEYFVKKSLDRLYKYSINDLGDYINKLAKIDRDFKSGKDNVSSFELFLYDKDGIFNNELK